MQTLQTRTVSANSVSPSTSSKTPASSNTQTAYQSVAAAAPVTVEGYEPQDQRSAQSLPVNTRGGFAARALSALGRPEQPQDILGEADPASVATRAEIASICAILLNLSGTPDDKLGTFVDVPAGHPAASAIYGGLAAGLFRGVGNGVFMPDAPIIEAHAQTILGRLTNPGARVPEDQRVAGTPQSSQTNAANGTLTLQIGELTALGEGDNENTSYIHWPVAGESGVTWGYGYDIGNRTRDEVQAHLSEAGVPQNQIDALLPGTGLKGQAAGNFVDANRERVGRISDEAKQRLLGIMLRAYQERARVTATSTTPNDGFNAASREQREGQPPGTYVMDQSEWGALHPAINWFLTDLIYQGGYYGYDRVARINERLKDHAGDPLAQVNALLELFQPGGYMDAYAAAIGEGRAPTGTTETFFGRTVDYGGSFRRNAIRRTYLEIVRDALAQGLEIQMLPWGGDEEQQPGANQQQPNASTPPASTPENNSNPGQQAQQQQPPPGTATQSYTVTATQLNVRSGPGTDNQVIGSLTKGQVVSGGPITNGWVQLSTGGYVSADYLTAQAQSAPAQDASSSQNESSSAPGTEASEKTYRVTASNGLNIRQSPSTTSPVVGSLAANSQVTGTLENGWLRLSDGRGYVSGSYVVEATNTGETTSDLPPQPANPILAPVDGTVPNQGETPTVSPQLEQQYYAQIPAIFALIPAGSLQAARAQAEELANRFRSEAEISAGMHPVLTVIGQVWEASSQVTLARQYIDEEQWEAAERSAQQVIDISNQLSQQGRVNASDAANLVKAAEGYLRRAQQNQVGGPWAHPLPGGVATSPFGWRGERNHNGVDISTGGGTAIRAVWPGSVVVPPFDDGGFGNWVILVHANGDETWYGHMSSISVQEGQEVAAGDELGIEGNTGGSRGAHLHIEYHPGAGAAVDPWPYLSHLGMQTWF